MADSLDLLEYSSYDGVGLGELVRQRKVDHKQLASLFILAVEKVNPKINAIVETYNDRAEKLDENTVPSGSFAGVPFLMKDYGSSEKSQRQEMGSRLMKGYVATCESFLTSRFKATGLNILGRTTTPELALAGTTESVLLGPTRNPWNLKMSTGGSSGGSCAAVAAGILPVAHASDAAGSIRIPASACGLVGLKPSRGRVTQGPEFGERPGGVFQEFMISRTVRDTAAMLDAVSKPAPGDPFVIIQPQNSYTNALNVPPEKLRLAWTAQSWQPGTEVDPEVVRCVEDVAERCKSIGFDIVASSPRFDYEEYLRALCIVFGYGFDAAVDELASIMGRGLGKETLEPLTISCYEFAHSITASDVMKAEYVTNKLRREFGQFFASYDVLMTPTLSRLPEPLGKYALTRTDLDFVGYFRLSDEMNMHLPIFNITGQPAITLPLGQSKSGLPIGVQFVAGFGREDLLLRLASVLERRFPWQQRIPAVHVSR